MFETIAKMFEPIVSIVSNLKDFPTRTGTVFIALLTLLIPLGVAILMSIYQKKDTEKKDYVELDINTALNIIFNKRLLFAIGFVFIPLFFWEFFNPYAKFFSVLLIGCGFSIVINIIWKIIKWVEGDVYKYRFGYLRELKDPEKLKVCWESVWSSKETNLIYIEKFTNIFADSICRGYFRFETIGEVYRNIISACLRLVENTIKDKQSPYSLVIAFLKLHYCLYCKLNCFPKQIISFLLEVEKDRFFANHTAIIQHILDKVSNKKYIDEIYPIYIDELFKDCKQNPEAEQYNEFFWFNSKFVFPKEWLVTGDNLKDNNNKYYSKICFDKLYDIITHWLQLEDETEKCAVQSQFETVFPYLLPEVILPDFFIIISHYYFLSKSENPFEKIISLKGLNETIDTLQSLNIPNYNPLVKEHFAQYKRDKNKTYQLAFLLFSNTYSKGNLEKYISELEKLNYETEPDKKIYRDELLRIFKEFREYIPTNPSQSPHNNA